MVLGGGVYMLVRRKFPVLLPLIAGLCACAGADARYPSLAMRAFETAPPPAPPATFEPIRPLVDAATLDTLVERAVAAENAFLRQQAVAEPLVRRAAGQPVESNARAAALVAMADLAAERGATSAVLADLDRLVAEAATTFAPTREIETARMQVLALVASQDATLTRLWEMMGR
jgi:hypothetical protein